VRCWQWTSLGNATVIVGNEGRVNLTQEWLQGSSSSYHVDQNHVWSLLSLISAGLRVCTWRIVNSPFTSSQHPRMRARCVIAAKHTLSS